MIEIVLPFLPQEWSEYFYGLRYLPKWPWHVWIIGILIIAIIAVFEGGYRQVELLKKGHLVSVGLPSGWDILTREKALIEDEVAQKQAELEHNKKMDVFNTALSRNS